MKKLVLLVAVAVVGLLAWLALRPGPEPSAATAPARADRATTTDPKHDFAPLELEHGAPPPVEFANAREAIATKSVPQPPRPIVRLVDERTNEPVPFFALEIATARHEHIAAVTDVDGRFELSDAIDTTLHFAENASGTDRIQTRRDCLPTLVQIVELAAAEFGDGVRDVRAPVGPTYRLRVAPPAGLTLADLTATLRPADPRQAFDCAFADVRDDATPWVRFRASARCLGGGPPWRLELATRDGLWFGAAEVPSNEGIQREIVAIEFASRARLYGSVHDDDGDVQAGFVRIEREGASFASADNRPLFGLIAADGKYAIRCVPAGRYTALFHAENHRDFEQQLDLAAGEERELAIVVARIPREALATLVGRVETASGAAHESLWAYAIPDGAGLSPRRVEISWKETDGRMVGWFSTEVPPGGYRVRIGGGLREIEPREQHWLPDSGTLSFLVRDASASTRLEFRASDPHSGTALSNFHVQLRVNDELDPTFDDVAAKDGVATFDAVPLGRVLAYRVLADGRQSVWGEIAGAQDSARSIIVELPTGWSSEIFVTDDAGAALAGARLTFDDKLAGVTDEHGSLRVSLDHAPTSARCELDGWKVVDAGDYSASSGRFRSWLPWLTLSMQRTR